KLVDYASSKNVLRELEYWNEIEKRSFESLEKERSNLENTWGDSRTLSISLNEKDTQSLLKDTHRAYKTDMNNLLLCTLGFALHECTGQEEIPLHLEGHGREQISSDLDVSRTIGWFTSIYPIVLKIYDSNNISYQIKTTKEMLRKIPNNGMNYNVLRYLKDEAGKSEIFQSIPDISFNYLGQFDQEMQEELFSISQLSSGTPISGDNERIYKLDIIAMIENGIFTLNVSFSNHIYTEQTITKFINSYKKHLLLIIEHCVTKDENEVTPSDFSIKNDTFEDLEATFSILESL
ncbi:hypothetical protein CON94_29840, partial [Bacillus pseudomycoides]|uniref:condensation domain-containing protein n=1 Tax=Bacillus pseudomycoides TaxID=64104 RepID=UPI000BEE5342